jgi:proline iminopeptidase
VTLDEILFPPIEPFDAGRLPVGGTHELYYEQCGNPEGRPLLFLHGGPGGGCKPRHRQYYDPGLWRIVLLDQRGSGRSTPRGELADNTTPHLVADIEALRLHLGIERWAISGGSWGSLLALAYAEAYPASCAVLLLRGVITGRRIERDWWWGGTRWLFPDAWAKFTGFLPAGLRDDPLDGYAALLSDPDEDTRHAAARAFGTYNSSTLLFDYDPAFVAASTDVGQSLPVARIFTHYCRHDFFVGDGALLSGVDAIRHIPAIIVQGRYDVITPMRTAWELAQAWPEAEFVVVNRANHSIEEEALAAAMIGAQRRLHARL